MSGLRAGPWLLPIPRLAAVHTTGLQAPVAPTAPVATSVGIYRVSMSIAITATGGGAVGQLIMSVVSDGEGGSVQTQSLVAVNAATLGDLAQDSFVVNVVAGNIVYKVDGVGFTAGSMQYAIRVIIEQLITP